MATFALTANSNFADATIGGTATSGRVGGDTYTIQNNFTLTQDSDTKYGWNTVTTTGPAGVVTINASTGGVWKLDGSNVWLIPYNTGSGSTSAAGGTEMTVTQGAVSGKVIGFWSAINAAPVAYTAAAIPAAGFIKVRQVTGGSFTSGGGALVFTGGTALAATITGNQTQGWIDVSMDQSATITIGRTGTFQTRGGWFELGTTNGARNQTMNLPTSGQATYYVPGVWIETAAGSGTYAYWPCLTAVTSGGWANTTQGSDARSPFVQCTGALIRIGSDGTNNIGALPVTGCKVRIPNITLLENTTAARQTVAVPNVVMATRPEFAVTGGAVIDMQVVSCNWFLNLVQAFSIDLVNVSVADNMLIQECGGAVNWNGGGIGVCTVLTTTSIALTMTSNLAGGTIQNCKFIRSGVAGSAAYGVSIITCLGLTFTDCYFGLAILRSNNTVAYGFAGTQSNNITLTRCTSNSGGFQLITCANWTITDSIIYDRGVSTTLTTFPAYCFALSAKCADITISGLSTNAIANVQPYNAILSAANCDRIKLRSIGTIASKYALGGTNPSRYIFQLAGNNYDVKIQKIYTSGAATASATYLNSDKLVLMEHVWGDTADKIIGSGTVDAPLEGIWKGCMGDSGTIQAAYTSVYGSIFYDVFTSATTGKLGVIMNEPTSSYSAYCSTTGTGKFTSAGNLYLPTLGDTAEFIWPHFVRGYTRFTNSPVVLTGGTTVSARMKLNYAIDTGSGFGAYSIDYTNLTTLGTALFNLGVFSATTGIKVKIKITCTSTDLANNTINTFNIAMTTDASSQQTTYPLDTVPVAITVKDSSSLAAIANARVRILTDVGGFMVLEGVTNGSGVLTGTTEYAAHAITGTVRRATVVDGTLYKPGSISGTTTSAGFSSTVLMIADE
jgi:hypothetical protein